MKFLHIADLHIGKLVNDFSMLEDQKFILEQIKGMAKANQVDMVVIAGDVYDRAIPPAEAVMLFDDFLTELSRAEIQVAMISGNHDSPERLCFGESLLDKQGVHIAGVQRDTLCRVSFSEPECETELLLLPFIKPAQLGVRTSGEAVEYLLNKYWEGETEDNCGVLQSSTQRKAPNAPVSRKNRILVTHFFVTDAGREPELSDSETTIHVGGLDNVDASLFQGFDYVALGHIHKPQQIGAHPIWYAGSPLKYSFGEINQTKSVLMVTMDGEGLKEVKKLPLHPLREMRRIRGSLKELLKAGENTIGENERTQDYIQAILTDKGELIDPIGTIRSRYPNVMQIVREEAEAALSSKEIGRSRVLAKQKDAMALFEAFYQEVRESELTEEGKKVIADIIKEAEG